MWPLRRINSSPSSTRSRSRSFSCSSFKDIQDLCTEEAKPETGSRPEPPRSPSIFHRVRIFSWAHRNSAPSSPTTRHHYLSSPPSSPKPKHRLSSSDKDKPAVVVYFTSLRVVRKTFEDCRAVRSILHGLRVPVDERDLSMDSRFVAEVQGILGRRRLSPPCVLVGGRLLGGAEEVRKLHESGELRALVAGGESPAVGRGACGACGGLRYVVCERCSGSRKIYSDKQGFKSCKACNVNGLIRCPSCSSY